MRIEKENKKSEIRNSKSNGPMIFECQARGQEPAAQKS